jgi:UDP-N-acetylmuramoyl-tripeptide--D-alanyl-D-alanine ligase
MLFQPTPAQLYLRLGAKPLVTGEKTWQQPVQNISTDSRTLSHGELFVALRGDRFDGHEFVEQVALQGASAIVVDSMFEAPEVLERISSLQTCTILQVPNTVMAYQDLGRWVREQFTGALVAVTGSVGKTTTKELIAAVLGTQGPVLKTEANYNNEIGVPKTLLGLEPNHRYAVIEMGMRGQGQIAELAKIALPDVSVITTVGTAHIELLGSEEAIAAAKCELLEHTPGQGIAILNHDNALLMATAAQVWTGPTLTFGLQGGDIHGQLLDSSTLVVNGITFHLPIPGEHNALNFLAALAVAEALGMSWEPLRDLAVTMPSGRAQRYVLANDVVVLDETYNAGLESMMAALKLLSQTPGDRRIAVLGTMRELGDYSVQFHQQVGEAVAELGIDELLILAEPAESEALAQGAGAVSSHQFANPEELLAYLQEQVRSGDRILFKASRAVALDRVVKAFCQSQVPQPIGS